MNLFRLLLRSVRYHRHSHFALMAGIAISSMVITGALIIGDSVKASLESLVKQRLGNTAYSFEGNDRLFRASLGDSLEKRLKIHYTPVMLLNGFASSQGGNIKVNGVQITGIDGRFDNFLNSGASGSPPTDNTAIISSNLAARLQIVVGDEILLRLEKAGPIPKNAPFVSDQDNVVSLRVAVSHIAADYELFEHFNLKNTQLPPYNIFVNLSYLNGEMELQNRANRLLVAEKGRRSPAEVERELANSWDTDDLGLQITPSHDSLWWEVRSDRVFLDSITVLAAKSIYPEVTEILTYMANSIKFHGNETPYSFVTAGSFDDDLTENEILINRWLADDLNAQPGDTLDLFYYSIGPLRELSEQQRSFVIKDIVDFIGDFNNPDLMPSLPGLSDAGSCREWEAGVPVDLGKIRDKDEAYWKTYRGTPKAFINYETGKSLWQNRYGNATILRIPADRLSINELKSELQKKLPPESQGIRLVPVRDGGLAAARSGVDFSQLFLGLSFFLIIAAIILTALLYTLHLEKRKSEVGTLKALGFSQSNILKMALAEGMIIGILGVLTGAILAIYYNKLVFYALNTMWFDIVRTPALHEKINPGTMVLGMSISLMLSLIILWYNTSKFLRKNSISLQKGIQQVRSQSKKRIYPIAAVAFIAIATGSFVYSWGANDLNPGLFFATAILLMAGILTLFTGWLRQIPASKNYILSMAGLVAKSTRRNPARSTRIVLLFAVGSFIVIAIGLNKKDLGEELNSPMSGTGGADFYMETSVPVLHDLNNPDVQVQRAFDIPMDFLQFRALDGDDASCLNLNRVVAPGILGVPSETMKGRFTFITSTEELDLADPWGSLGKILPGNVIPAVMDQTVIQWGLGRKIGDTLVYRDESGAELRLKLIGGLANSVFQGKVLIDQHFLQKHFPTSGGSNVFLVNSHDPSAEISKEELLRIFRTEGPELTLAADRLALFNQVENTYLSIFMILGGLALILGTIGLGISLARTILDRRKEIAILRATGFEKKHIISMFITEHMALLAMGTLTGTLAAFIAIWPSLHKGIIQASLPTALTIIGLILLNGIVWTTFITRMSLGKSVISELREE
ncbi:MAG: FtsX-like permease family protein [Cyclobacteriaceae bacterium]|nr:FtsX-like permease family protein [Cyclobacteriaceae bacterium]